MSFFSRRTGTAAGAAILALLSGLSASAAEGPTLLAEEAAAAVPVTEERRVIVEGIRGEIALRPGDVGLLSFESTRGGATKAPLPVAIWLDDAGTFRLAPPEGARELPRVLTVWVPPGMKSILRVDGSAIGVSGVEGEVEVRGQRDRLDAANVGGALTAEIQGGTVNVSRSGGDVAIRGRELNVTVAGVAGALSLRVSGGTATVSGVGAGIEGDLDNVELKVDEVQGLCRLRLRGGKAELSGLGRDAELSLSGAPLKLARCKGAISIESDRDVEFRELEAALRVTLFGGSLRGATNKGSVDVKSTGAEDVQLQSISGSVSVEGAGVRTRLSDIGADVSVKTSSGTIEVDNATGPLTIEADAGSVQASRVFSEVKVTSRGGDVRLTDLNGAVEVKADGAQVEVSWASVPTAKDSSIENEGGGVIVRFPQSGGCRVEAGTKYGRIETEGLPRVVVQDGGAAAQGLVGRMNRPVLKISANGDVRLIGSEGAEGAPR